MKIIRKFLAFWYRLIQWILKYPAKSVGHRIWILFDYLSLFCKKGITKEEYYEYEFENRSEEFRNTFLGKNEQRLYLDLLNPIKYYIISRNKYLAHKVLEDTGVRKSKLYCYYDPNGRIFNSSEIASTITDVCRILKKKNVSDCVIKDTENSHGYGVIVVKKIEYIDNDCIMYCFNGNSVKLSEILDNHPKIFEDIIKQTPQLASFNASSVNTIRIITTLMPDGSAKIVAACMRIGRAGSCVDNAGSGGNVDACVDIMSGEIKNATQFDGWRKMTDIEKHPDSGTQLNGVLIENWKNIKEDVIRFQQAMPWCKAAGWDIAITDQGPVIIEVNDFWDPTFQYFIRRGWRYEIRECYEAWKKIGVDDKMYRMPNELTLGHLSRIYKNE